MKTPSAKHFNMNWLKAAIFAAFCFLATASHGQLPAEPVKLGQLEVEVKLLRAEMALVDGRLQVARELLQTVEPQLRFYPLYRPRWTRLRQQLEDMPAPAHGSVSAHGPPPFSCSRPFVALLPLSGSLGEAGQAIVNALKIAGCAPVDVLDTELFDAEALREMVALYRPEWVLGPLRPNRVDAWVEQAPEWPTLLLGRSRSGVPCPVCFSLTLRPQDQLHGVMEDIVGTSGPNLVLVPESLREQIPALQQLSSRSAWLFFHHRLADALQSRLGIQASRSRSRYLQHVLGHPVQSVPRARGDLFSVVMIGSQAQAQQVGALLDFWQVSTRFVWLPSRLQRALPRALRDETWPVMVAMLPPFAWQTDGDTFETGMFRALGESVVKRLQAKSDQVVMTPLGRMEWIDGQLKVTFVPYVHERGTQWQPLMKTLSDE